MGNVVPTLLDRAQDMHVILQTEFPEFLHHSQIGKGKFMKTHIVTRVAKDTGKPQGQNAPSTEDAKVGINEKAVVKIYVKRDKALDSNKRIIYVRSQLMQLCRAFTLERMPNILPYQRFEDGTRNEAAFLIRQHFMYNLFDRMHTRPFLTPVEKQWYIYQVLRALVQMHSANIRHGDIKSENVMVTSWGWLLLTDFAVFKPTYIPEDHPASFYYFFEAGSRRRCYLAPERFVKERDLEKASMAFGSTESGSSDAKTPAAPLPASPPPAPIQSPPLTQAPTPCDPALTAAMDVFAAGCLIAEIALDGEPFMDLSTLLRYKSWLEFDPMAANGLSEAFSQCDPTGQLFELVRLMIQRDPAARPSAEALLEQFSHAPKPMMPFFPPYFGYLADLLSKMVLGSMQSPDLRVLSICANYSAMIHALTGGLYDLQGAMIMRHRLSLEPDHVKACVAPSLVAGSESASKLTPYSYDAQISTNAANELMWEWDFDTEIPYGTRQSENLTVSTSDVYRKWTPYVSDSEVLTSTLSGGSNGAAHSHEERKTREQRQEDPATRLAAVMEQLKELSKLDSADVDVKTTQHVYNAVEGASGGGYKAAAASEHINGSGFTIVLALLTSCLRHLSCPRTKVTALLLIGRLSVYAEDECRLQRVVPYLMTQLTDPAPCVKAHAAYCITSTLEYVQSFPASDALIFPQYIFQAFSRLMSDPDTTVQLAAAECLPRLALSARNFLDIAQWKSQLTSLQRILQPTPALTAQPTFRQGSFFSTMPSSPLQTPSTGEDVPPLPLPTSSSSGTASVHADGSGGQKLSSDYDKKLDEIHRRMQDLLQKWITAASAGATATVASATVDANAVNHLRSLHSGFSSLHLFNPEVLQKFAHAFASFPATTDTSLAKRVMLRHAAKFCSFFGRTETEDFFLPILITFLGDPVASTAITAAGSSLIPLLLPAAVIRHARQTHFEDVVPSSFLNASLSWLSKSPIGTGDWQLRDGFLQQIVHLSALVGPYNTEHTLVPFVEQGLTDVNEPVVHRALVALSELLQHKLLAYSVAADFIRRFAPLVCHPSGWIRSAMCIFIAVTWNAMGWPKAFTETGVHINPLIKHGHVTLCWESVKSTLEGETNKLARVPKLTSVVRTHLLGAVSRSSFDRECHRSVMTMVRLTAPTMAEILLPDMPAAPSGGSALSPDVFSAKLHDFNGISKLNIGPMLPEDNTAEFSDSEDDDAAEDATPQHIPATSAGGLYMCVPSAPAFKDRTERQRYALEKMRGYISAVAGAYRVSVQPSMRLQALHESKTSRNQDALAGRFIPDLPFTQQEITDLPLHSISVPDQRYASVHPALPRMLAGRTQNPQDEQQARRLAAVGHLGVFESDDQSLPHVAVNMSADGVTPLVSSASVLQNSLRIPLWRYAKYASAPLPQHLRQYRQALCAGRNDGAMAIKLKTAPSSLSALPFHWNVMCWEKEGTVDATHAPRGPPVTQSPVAHLFALRKFWRRGGRQARKLYLRHGIWDPFLLTDGQAALAPTTGVGTSNAFFYSRTEQEDPTLYSSDEESSAPTRISTGDGTPLPLETGTASHTRSDEFRSSADGTDIDDFAIIDDEEGRPTPLFDAADVRMKPSMVAVRYSTAAQHAITASDSTWLLIKLSAWANAAGISLPGSGGTGDRSFLGPSTMQTAAASQRHEAFQRRRIGRAPRCLLNLKHGLQGADFANDFVFPDLEMDVRRARANEGSNVKKSVAVIPAVAGRGRQDNNGLTVRIADGSFIQNVHDAEIAAQRAGPLRKANKPKANPKADREGVTIIPQYLPDEGAKAGGGARKPSFFEKSVNKGNDNRDYLAPDAVDKLARRVEALGIPPLAPHLGVLSKSSDPPAPIVSHAVRVSVGISGPDSLSSVAPGVGGGGLGVPAAAAPPGYALALDESVTTTSISSGSSSGVDARPSARDPASARAPASSDDGFEIITMSGESASSMPTQEGRLSCIEVSPVMLPIPLHEDVMRPGDVGDGTGYIGSSESSFMGVERGWRDALGLPGPQTAGPSEGDAHQTRFVPLLAPEPSAEAQTSSGGGGGSGGKSSTNPVWDGGDGSWGSRPKGILVASLYEHSAAITSLSVCQDQSFFVSSSDDGTVKIWDTRSLGKSVVPSSLLTYTGHLQEVRNGDVARGIPAGKARVTDAIICDNSTSVASGSAAGTVHVFRVDTQAARSVGRAMNAASLVPEYASPSESVYSDFERRKSTHGSFVNRGNSNADRMDVRHSVDDDVADVPSVQKASIRAPDSVAVLRRLAFDAEEGGIVAIRHYQSAIQSVLAIATSGGVLHGCDLRARTEAWSCKIPSVFGSITAMELCPGSTSAVIGTDRGVIILYDLRFSLIIAAWRHSARSPIHTLYPYVTLAVRECTPNINAPLFCAEKVSGSTKIIPVARQLAVGIGTGQNETSFWNLETGTCLRLLRSLPEQIHAADAYRVPYLTPIELVNGTVSASNDSAGLLKSTAAMNHAIQELTSVTAAPRPIRSILCPLPSSQQPILGVAPSEEMAAAALRSEGHAAGGGQPGLSVGFVLGGLRGAGATRRKDSPFGVAYTLNNVEGKPTLMRADELREEDIGYVYGGTPLEGLPVWMLTGGEDRVVRCWDLDRPRASHTVVGLRPGETRDAYEGAWLAPVTGDTLDDEDEEEEDVTDKDNTSEEKTFTVRKAEHFLTYDGADGMSGSSRPNKYRNQGIHPIRAIFAQSMYDPSKEADIMGAGGAMAHPSALLRGPVPAPGGHNTAITAMAWLDSPARLLLTGCADGVVKVWR